MEMVRREDNASDWMPRALHFVHICGCGVAESLPGSGGDARHTPCESGLTPAVVFVVAGEQHPDGDDDEDGRVAHERQQRLGHRPADATRAAQHPGVLPPHDRLQHGRRVAACAPRQGEAAPSAVLLRGRAHPDPGTVENRINCAGFSDE